MFEAIKNDKIVQDLQKLADQIKQLNKDAAEANSSTVGRFTTGVLDQLSKVQDHVREMIAAKLRHDELEESIQPPEVLGQEDL